MKARNPLAPFNKAGFNTLPQLAEAIEKYKILPLANGGFMLGPPGPIIRGAGAVRWQAAFAALEDNGFDWKKHISPGPPIIEWTNAKFSIPPHVGETGQEKQIKQLIQAVKSLEKSINSLRAELTATRAELKKRSL